MPLADGSSTSFNFTVGPEKTAYSRPPPSRRLRTASRAAGRATGAGGVAGAGEASGRGGEGVQSNIFNIPPIVLTNPPEPNNSAEPDVPATSSSAPSTMIDPDGKLCFVTIEAQRHLFSDVWAHTLGF